jgi:transposase
LCRGGWKKSDPREPADHALGRSRGGFSTKLHLVCDGQGNPLHFELTAGQAHETTAFIDSLRYTDVRACESQVRVSPVALAGDKAYRAQWIIKWLEKRGIQPVIPEKGARANDESNPNFDRELYRRRNVVERLAGWLKECRRVFSRFEKTAINYAGMITVAIIQRYLRMFCPNEFSDNA